jgi:hypothetical protein
VNGMGAMTCVDTYPLLFPFTLCSAKEMSWSLSSTPAMLAASRRCMSVVHCVQSAVRRHRQGVLDVQKERGAGASLRVPAPRIPYWRRGTT